MRRALVVFVLMSIVGACGGEEWPATSQPAGPVPTTPAATAATPTTKPPRAHGSGPTSLPDIGSIGVADAIAGNKGLFDYERKQLESTLRLQRDPTLKAFSFDDQTNVIRVAFAYAHPERESRPLYDDFAWQTGRTLANAFWLPELVTTLQSHHGRPEFLPRLHIDLDDVSYVCPAAVQITMARSGVGREHWLADCSI